ncbi:MAG: NAD-dependent deacetylase [Bdellovibrionales bacterium]
MNPTDINQAKEWIESAKKIRVFTGAGVSAESGVPTFRSAGGLWDKYDPQELATKEAFESDPKLVWSWYQWRRELIEKCEPNFAHSYIYQLEQKVEDFFLITQNVDGIHERAGSKKMVNLHGQIHKNHCLQCGEVYKQAYKGLEFPPRCEACGGLVRPSVVWFGESLNAEAVDLAFKKAESSELFLCIGTAAVVQPAATVINIAHRSGSKIIEINPEASAATPYVHLHLKATAVEAFRLLSE